MLIQFRVENYLSFKEEAVLDMIPAKSRTMNDHIIRDEQGKKTSVLPIVTIYGANASGKSNLVKALDFMRKFILKDGSIDKPIGVVPFLLDSDTESLPSKFEIDIKVDGVVYSYGFVVNNKVVLEEWLFAYFSNKESKLFERVTDGDKVLVDAGSKLISNVEKKGFIGFVSQGTRPNQLFLSEAYNRNIEIVAPVVSWFKDRLKIIIPQSRYVPLSARLSEDAHFVDFLSNFLDIAGTGVSKIVCEKTPLEHSSSFKELPEDLKSAIHESLQNENNAQIKISYKEPITILKSDEEKYVLALKAKHLKVDGSYVSFDAKNESDGTRRLMDLAPLLSDTWIGNHVCVIDELDRSLHTHLSKLFVSLCIHRSKKETSRSQFVITTHDTNLLDRDVLRKDEILFVEKDRLGASHLTSLADFNVSEGLNYENGYLNGRFGAIPFIGNIDKLFSDREV